MATPFLTKLNGWSKVIATLLGIAVAYGSLVAKLDKASDTAATATTQMLQVRIEMAELRRDFGAMNERLARIEGAYDANRRR